MLSTALLLAWSFASLALGAETKGVAVKEVLTGLKNPHGVAVRPDGSGDSHEVFVAESGAGRVFKILTSKPDKRIDVVSGFSTKPAQEDGPTTAGAHSLHFLDHMRLVVAGGSDDGTPFLRLYEISEPESPLTSDQHKHEAAVPEAGNESNLNTHAFRGLARTQPNDRVGDSLIVVAPSDENSAGLVNVPVRSGTLGDAVLAPLRNAEGDSQIGAVSIGGNGYVVLSTNARGDSAQPSRLVFFSPIDRRIVMQLSTDLQRIVAVAYSPKTGDLFVANSPTNDDGRAGIYRIDRDAQGRPSACSATKIADVRQPTAIAFAPDGTLYVTASGDSNSTSVGLLLSLTGGL